MTEVDRILKLPEVMEMVGLRHSTIYSMIKEGRFPKSIKLGSRAIGWPKSFIDNWINERIMLSK